jgi:hypothetical protein
VSRAAEPAATAPAYVARAGDVRRDRDAVLGVWRGNLGRDDRIEAKYDWFYLGCPWGEPQLLVLRHAPSAATVGATAAGPRRMLLEGRALRAGVLVDMAVTTQHRSLGPALTLQKAMMAAGEARFELLYGFPNQKAAPVFKRVGYAKLGELVRYARVLRHGDHLARIMPRAAARPLGWLLDGVTAARQELAARRERETTARWVDAVVPQMDDLWTRSEHGSEAIAIRDTTMLRWRFDDAPLAKTRYLLVEGSRGGALEAWFACQTDGAVMHVRDFWAIDAAEGIGQRFLGALLRAARRAGHDVVSFEYAGPPERRVPWLDAGFVERSRRPIYGRWGAAVRGGRQLHLTSADEDE